MSPHRRSFVPVVRLAAVATVLAATLVPARAETLRVNGTWQSEGKEATFEVALCGDGTQLCGTLVTLRPDVVTDDNKHHLGQIVIDNAKSVGPDTWSGLIHYLGYDLQGTIVLQSPERIQLNGCLMMVLCKTFYLDRQQS